MPAFADAGLAASWTGVYDVTPDWNPVLGPLHHRAVAWRRARFAELMQAEPWRALFGRLLMTPPSHTLSVEVAQQIVKYTPAV